MNEPTITPIDFVLPNLGWLRSFEAVARHGSFTRAAAELGLTQAAVSSHIKALEHQLGCALFLRTTRQIALTEIGRAYLPAVRKALAELVMATAGLFGGPIAGAVTIRAPISTVVLLLAPRLDELSAQHPGLRVRMVSAIWAGAVLDTRVDLDIRLGDGAWPDCKAELLCEDDVVPVCAPHLAADLSGPAELSGLPLIQIIGFDDHWARYSQAHFGGAPMPRPRYQVDTTLAAIELAAAGAGVALVLERVGRRLAKDGRIAVAMPETIPMGQAHFLAHPLTPMPVRPQVQVVEAWLRSVLAGSR